MKPIYALRNQRDSDRYLRTAQRRLRDRMVAGRMAMGFLKEAVTGVVPGCIKRNRAHDHEWRDQRWTDARRLSAW